MDVHMQREYQKGIQLLQNNSIRAKLERAFVVTIYVSLTIIASTIFIITFPFRCAAKFIRGAPKPAASVLKIPLAVHEPEGGMSTEGVRDTLLFIHGFPDSSALWDATVSTLVKSGYRCLVVDLPASHGKLSTRDLSFGKVVQAIHDAVVNAGYNKVSIIGHDWGAMYTHMLASDYPEMTKRLAFLDVSGRPDLPLLDTMCVVSYQLYFAVCYYLGDPIGAWGVRIAAHMFGYCARPISELTADMVWPYPVMLSIMYRKAVSAMTKKDNMSSQAQQLETFNNVPIFFAYGAKKEFFFHDFALLNIVRASPCGKIQSFESDHWFFHHFPQLWLDSLTSWLEQSHRHVSQSSK